MRKPWIVTCLMAMAVANCYGVSPPAPDAGPVQITVLSQILKDNLPERPIGVSENLFFSSDKHYPARRHTQAEALRAIGGQTVRGMEGKNGDFLIWAMPPFDAPAMRLTCYHPGRGYMSNFYNADGTVQKAMEFDEFVSTGRGGGVREFFYIIGIDAIKADPQRWQWVIPHPQETIVAGAAALAKWCRQQNVSVWFEIGNETDLEDPRLMLGKWTAEEYAGVAARLSGAIKAEYPQAKVGINGEFTKGWLDRVIPKVYEQIDFVVAHAYTPRSTWPIQRTNLAIDKAAIPESYKKKWPICVTETSSYWPGKPVNNDLEEATRNFIRMGLNLREPRVAYMHFWTDRSADRNPAIGKSALSMDGDLLPMGRVLSIWNEQLKRQLLKVECDDKEVYAFATRAGGGKSTGPVTLFLANQGAAAKAVMVRVEASHASGPAAVWAFTGADAHDRSPRWEKQDPVQVREGTFSRELSPLGFVMIELGE